MFKQVCKPHEMLIKCRKIYMSKLCFFQKSTEVRKKIKKAYIYNNKGNNRGNKT